MHAATSVTYGLANSGQSALSACVHWIDFIPSPLEPPLASPPPDPPPPSPSPDLPPPDQPRVFSSELFTVKEIDVTWTQAKADCEAEGLILAYIFNADETAELLALVTNNFEGRKQVYLGLNDRETQNQWVWADGSPLSYTNWQSGEPSNSWNSHHSSREDCGALWTTAGEWNDVPCLEPLPYACRSLPSRTT